MLRRAAVIVGCAVSASACGGGAEVPKATSGFDLDDDGWTIVGDAQAQSVKPDYAGTGGNPDGLIKAKDDVTGGVWYFKAPGKYLGDASDHFGRRLSFDLQVTAITDPFSDEDLKLVGGGLTIVLDLSPDPGVTWTRFGAALDTSADWRLDKLGGAVATEAQVKTVLGALTDLLIRGEFNTGPDTGALDNVRFGGPT